MLFRCDHQRRHRHQQQQQQPQPQEGTTHPTDSSDKKHRSAAAKRRHRRRSRGILSAIVSGEPAPDDEVIDGPLDTYRHMSTHILGRTFAFIESDEGIPSLRVLNTDDADGTQICRRTRVPSLGHMLTHTLSTMCVNMCPV